MLNTHSQIDEQIVEIRKLISINPIQAITKAKKLLQKVESNNYQKGIADVCRLIVVGYQVAEKSSISIPFINKALLIYQTFKDKKGIAACYNDFGGVYYRLANYEEAIHHYHLSLAIKEELNDQKGIASSLINIGNVFGKQENPLELIRYNQKALKVSKSIKDRQLIASCLYNIGNGFNDLHKPIKGLGFLKKALSIVGDNDVQLKTVILINMGISHGMIWQLEEAIQFFSKGLEISRPAKMYFLTAMALQNLGELFLLKNELDSASNCLEQSLGLGRKYKYPEVERNCYQHLSTLHYMLHDFHNAKKYFIKFNYLLTKQINSDTHRELNEMQVKYEADKKEKEAEISRLKNVELKDALDKLQQEQLHADELLKNILPEDIAEELKAGGGSKPPVRFYESVTVMFTDIKDFTIHSERRDPSELVKELDYCFMKFDEIIGKHHVEKIKTIGDAYMCVCGLPKPNIQHATKIIKAAIEIRDFMEEYKKEKIKLGQMPFEIRIGVHTGGVIAGIIGTKKFAYDIWGDTVNTAARMEQNSEPGKINISHATYLKVKKMFPCTHRGKHTAKNKGEVDMYYVEV